jgi:hypothetical protein
VLLGLGGKGEKWCTNYQWYDLKVKGLSLAASAGIRIGHGKSSILIVIGGSTVVECLPYHTRSRVLVPQLLLASGVEMEKVV